MDDARAVLLALATSVGSRTLYLKDQVDVAALVNAGNTFLTEQHYTNSNADAPFFTVTGPANPWRCVWKGFASGTITIRCYVGNADHNNGFLIWVVNAHWKFTGSQAWVQEDTGHDSYALVLGANGLLISRVAAGAANWSEWPATGHTVQAETVRSTSFDLTPDVTFTDVLPLAGSSGDLFWLGIGGALGFAHGPDHIFGLTGKVFVPLRVPRFVVPGVLHISFSQNTTNQMTFTVMERSVNYTTPGAAGLTTTGLTVTSSASSGFQLKTITLSGYTFDRAKEYVVACGCGDAGDFVQGMQITGSVASKLSYGIGG